MKVTTACPAAGKSWPSPTTRARRLENPGTRGRSRVPRSATGHWRRSSSARGSRLARRFGRMAFIKRSACSTFLRRKVAKLKPCGAAVRRERLIRSRSELLCPALVLYWG